MLKPRYSESYLDFSINAALDDFAVAVQTRLLLSIARGGLDPINGG